MAKIMWQTELTIAEINEKIEASEIIEVKNSGSFQKKLMADSHPLELFFSNYDDIYPYMSWAVIFCGSMRSDDDKTFITGKMDQRWFSKILYITVGTIMFLIGAYTLIFVQKDDWLMWVCALGFTFVAPLFSGAFVVEHHKRSIKALALLKETLEATDIETE